MKEESSEDLIKVDLRDYVVLNSGGPLLKLECIEGDNAVVSWEEGRRIIPVACLSRLVPLKAI